MADEPIVQKDLFSGTALAGDEIFPDIPTEDLLFESNEALILPCGASKNPAACALEAYERYTGPMWKEARATVPEGTKLPAALKDAGVDMYILSAKHGLIPADELIEDYDVKMTPERLEEIKADKTLTESIKGTLSRYKPDKVRLGTPKSYTKLITDVMGPEAEGYSSVFEKGSGSGLQKKGIVDFLRSRIQGKTGTEMVPYEDPRQPNLPMGERKKLRGAQSLSKGIGTLARRYSPIMNIISAAQMVWDELPSETKDEITTFMTRSPESLYTEDGLDYFRRLLGITPEGGIMEVANEIPETVQLDLVNDFIKKTVKNEGVGGLFDFDYGEDALRQVQERQRRDVELQRKMNIIDKAANPYELKKYQSSFKDPQFKKVSSDPLFEVVDLNLPMQKRPTKGNIFRGQAYRQLMGDDPKFREGETPPGFTSEDMDYMKKEGLIYEAPRTNYFVEPVHPPVEIPEIFNSPSGVSYGDMDQVQLISSQLDQQNRGERDPNIDGFKQPDFARQSPPEDPSVYAYPDGSPKTDHPSRDLAEKISRMNFKQMAGDRVSYLKQVIQSYERNIENVNGRIERIQKNPQNFGLDLTAVQDEVEGYKNFSIPSIEKRIDQLNQEIEKLTNTFIEG